MTAKIFSLDSIRVKRCTSEVEVVETAAAPCIFVICIMFLSLFHSNGLKLFIGFMLTVFTKCPNVN